MTEDQLLADFPGVEDYLRLRDIAGLSGFSAEAAEAGLKNTTFGVSILRDNNPIAMGRIIGDGGCFFQVVDIAVDPAHQGRGLGRRIMAALTEHIETALPDGAYVSLIADCPADRLYEQFGFVATAPESIGMARRGGAT